jgi:hypothetical protein
MRILKITMLKTRLIKHIYCTDVAFRVRIETDADYHVIMYGDWINISVPNRYTICGETIIVQKTDLHKWLDIK